MADAISVTALPEHGQYQGRIACFESLVEPTRFVQAARTAEMNRSTSAERRLPARDSVCAEERTWADAEVMPPALSFTSAILVATCAAPLAAAWTFSAICWVVAACRSTAAAIAAAISEMRLIVPPISLMD